MTTVFQPFGKYELLGELGAGGMGRVYHARDTVLNRPVALKIVRADLLAADDAEQRLRLEAQAAASLDHPHIVRVLEVGEQGDRLFLAMELIRGGSLAERLADGFAYAPRASAQFFVPLARAVEHAHQHGVLHRDLKPSNILLDEAGAPHLTDFGLAKFMALDTGLTISHAPLGTCGYMAPEVAVEGARAATIASDIYGLGAVLYELLAGRPPYASASYSEFLRQIEREDPLPPLAVRPGTQKTTANGPPAPAAVSGFERDLELICRHCLQREPAKRYPSAGALADDLERLLRGEPITVRAPRPHELAAAWVRRHRVAASVAGTVAIALFVGLTATLWQLRRAERFLAESQQSNGELRRQDVRRSLQEFQTKSADEFRRGALHELTLLYRRYPTNQIVAGRLWSALLERPHLLRRLPSLPHAGQVYCAEFLADGANLLTGSVESAPSIYLWNLQTGTLRGKVPHDLSLMPIATDHEGRRLVTLDAEGRVHVWNLPELSELDGPWTYLPAATQAALCPSGAMLAATYVERKLAVWKVETGELAWETEIEAGPHRLCFSANDRLLLAAGKSGRGTVYATNGGQVETNLNSALGPLGQVVASPIGDGFLRVGENSVRFDPACGAANPPFEFVLTNETVRVARLSPDGQCVAIASSGGWLREYSLRTGEPTHRCVDLGDGTDGLNYSDANADLAITTGNGIAWFVPFDPRQRHPEPVKAGVFAYDVRYSPDGGSVALVAGEGQAHVFRTAPRLEMEPVRLAESNVVQWAVSPRGDCVAILDSQGRVGLRRMDLGAAFEPWLRPEAEVRSLEFSPSGRWLMVRDVRGLARLIATSNPGGMVLNLEHDQSFRPAFAFSQDENRLLLATESHIHVWNLAGSEPLKEAAIAEPRVRVLVLSPDGARLALDSERIWEGQLYDTRTWKVLPRKLSHGGPVDQLQFSRDSRWIATGSQDRTARVWLAADGTPLSPVLQNGFDGLCLAFHPTGRELFTGGWKGAIRRWQIPGGDPDPRDFSAAAPPHFLACGADGHWLLSAGGGFTQVWDVDSGTSLLDPIRVGETDRPWAMTPPRFTVDGKHLILVEPPEKGRESSDNGMVSVIRLPLDDVPDYESLLALAQLSLDGLLNEAGGLTALDATSLADLYRKAEPILKAVQPSRVRQMRFYKPESH